MCRNTEDTKLFRRCPVVGELETDSRILTVESHLHSCTDGSLAASCQYWHFSTCATDFAPQAPWDHSHFIHMDKAMQVLMTALQTDTSSRSRGKYCESLPEQKWVTFFVPVAGTLPRRINQELISTTWIWRITSHKVLLSIFKLYLDYADRCWT